MGRPTAGVSCRERERRKTCSHATLRCSNADFEQALCEMVRVLKPGGQIVIGDVAHIVTACAARLRAAGLECQVVETGRFLGYDQGIVFGKKAG